MGENTKHYVLGFAITRDAKILLCHKMNPEWQRGKVNGIGGKLENGETHYDAILREAEEEAGLGHLDWELRGDMQFFSDGEVVAHVSIFSARCMPGDFQQREDEIKKFYTLEEALQLRLIPNLRYLLPFILYGGEERLHLTYAPEGGNS